MEERPAPFLCPPAGTAFAEVSGGNVAALFNPRPAVLIGSYKGRANFATVAWATPVSHDPALVAFALRPASKTFQDVMDTGCFSINTLDASLLGAARLCGNRTGHTFDKGACVPHRLEAHVPYGGPKAGPASGRPTAGPAPGAQVPFVEGALSIVDCEVESVRPTGDHSLVIAYVCRALTRCATDGDGTVFATGTLLCIQHHHYILGDPRCLEAL